MVFFMYIIRVKKTNECAHFVPGWAGKFLHAFIILMGMVSGAVAQIPQGVPKPQNNDPVAPDSPSDLIIYIILPAVLIVTYLFILYRRRKKRRQEDQESNEWEKKHRP